MYGVKLWWSLVGITVWMLSQVVPVQSRTRSKSYMFPVLPQAFVEFWLQGVPSWCWSTEYRGVHLWCLFNGHYQLGLGKEVDSGCYRPIGRLSPHFGYIFTFLSQISLPFRKKHDFKRFSVKSACSYHQGQGRRQMCFQ